jgi:predicted phage-related endonuclease
MIVFNLILFKIKDKMLISKNDNRQTCNSKLQECILTSQHSVQVVISILSHRANDHQKEFSDISQQVAIAVTHGPWVEIRHEFKDIIANRNSTSRITSENMEI